MLSEQRSGATQGLRSQHLLVCISPSSIISFTPRVPSTSICIHMCNHFTSFTLSNTIFFSISLTWYWSRKVHQHIVPVRRRPNLVMWLGLDLTRNWKLSEKYILGTRVASSQCRRVQHAIWVRWPRHPVFMPQA